MINALPATTSETHYHSLRRSPSESAEMSAKVKVGVAAEQLGLRIADRSVAISSRWRLSAAREFSERIVIGLNALPVGGVPMQERWELMPARR